MGTPRVKDILKFLLERFSKNVLILRLRVWYRFPFLGKQEGKELVILLLSSSHSLTLEIFPPSFLSVTGQTRAQSRQPQILELLSVSLLLSRHIQATTVSCLHLLNLEAISAAVALVDPPIYFLDHFPIFLISLPVACPMRPSYTLLLDGFCKTQLAALLSQHIWAP